MGVLERKIAVITGGTTGIGEATARLFKAEGATVVVMGANPVNIERAKRELGVDAVPCDVGSVPRSQPPWRRYRSATDGSTFCSPMPAFRVRGSRSMPSTKPRSTW